MPRTASEMTVQEWQAYDPWAAAKRVTEQEKMQVAKRRRQAWRVARQAAKLLRSEFGATNVVLFGSLAHKAWFTLRSDIDLAARGIPVDHFYKAVAAMIDFSPSFKIDLVDPGDCSPRLRQAIDREGIDV